MNKSIHWFKATLLVSSLFAMFNMPLLQAKEATLMAKDPAVEKRMMALGAELRCLVCQNQTIADSHADLAKDLKREIRTLIKEGKTDNEIKAFMVERYGDFILYRPPFQYKTLLLWLGPLGLLIIGGIVLVRIIRSRQQNMRELEVSASEHDRIDALLNNKD